MDWIDHGSLAMLLLTNFVYSVLRQREEQSLFDLIKR